jgi:hypothetical protein
VFQMSKGTKGVEDDDWVARCNHAYIWKNRAVAIL